MPVETGAIPADNTTTMATEQQVVNEIPTSVLPNTGNQVQLDEAGLQQVTTAYQGLSSSQQSNFNSFEDFRDQVIGQQDQFAGLNLDAAIGNVIPANQKAVTATSGAENFVDKQKQEVDDYYQREKEYNERQQQQNFTTEGKQDLPGTTDDMFDEIEAEFQEVNNLLEARKVQLDQRGQQQIANVQRIYENRRVQMRTQNANRQKGLEILGSRTGRQRYAPEVQSGILSAEEQAGLKRLSELDAEEQMLIQQIQAGIDDESFGLLMEQVNQREKLRKEKASLLDSLMTQAIEQEKLAIEKAKQSREDLRFQLDVAKFEEEVRSNDFDNAYKFAQNNGYRLGMNDAGEPIILDQLTFENQLKLDQFQFEVDKFGFEATMQEADLELRKNGFYLDQARFEQDIQEFGMEYALKQANLSLNQQQMTLDRYNAGIPTTYDQLGIDAPEAKIAEAIGQSIVNVTAQTVGKGSIRSDGGWECAEFVEQIVHLGTPGNVMGDTFTEKKRTVDQYGLTKDEVLARGGFAVGDVIITDGSDVSASGDPLLYGHAAVVAGIDANGNLILHEANRKNDGQISTGRTISANSSSIYGVLGRPNEKSTPEAGIKDFVISDAIDTAAQNYVEHFNSELDKQLDKLLTIDEQKEYNAPAGSTWRDVMGETPGQGRESVAVEVYTLAKSIKENGNLRAATGPIGQYLPSLRTLTGGTTNLMYDFNRLKNLMTLENLGLMKGVLSETDIQILTNAATSLDKGMTTGKLYEELDRIIAKTAPDNWEDQDAVNRYNSYLQSGTTEEQDYSEYYNKYDPNNDAYANW